MERQGKGRPGNEGAFWKRRRGPSLASICCQLCVVMWACLPWLLRIEKVEFEVAIIAVTVTQKHPILLYLPFRLNSLASAQVVLLVLYRRRQRTSSMLRVVLITWTTNAQLTQHRVELSEIFLFLNLDHRSNLLLYGRRGPEGEKDQQLT